LGLDTDVFYICSVFIIALENICISLFLLDLILSLASL